LRWTVAAVADAATRFRRITGAREGMTELMRALARHETLATARRIAHEGCLVMALVAPASSATKGRWCGSRIYVRVPDVNVRAPDRSAARSARTCGLVLATSQLGASPPHPCITHPVATAHKTILIAKNLHHRRFPVARPVRLMTRLRPPRREANRCSAPSTRSPRVLRCARVLGEVARRRALPSAARSHRPQRVRLEGKLADQGASHLVGTPWRDTSARSPSIAPSGPLVDRPRVEPLERPAPRRSTAR
jgi:hypothetical protein